MKGRGSAAITPQQARMARGALGLSCPKAARMIGCSTTTLERFEDDLGVSKAMAKMISDFYRDQGVSFDETEDRWIISVRKDR